MIEFKRNKETGILEAYKDGKKIGTVETMGDDVKEKDEEHNISDPGRSHRRNPERN